jgi:hypothetical protein
MADIDLLAIPASQVVADSIQADVLVTLLVSGRRLSVPKAIGGVVAAQGVGP